MKRPAPTARPTRTVQWEDLPPVLVLAGVVAVIPGGLFPFVCIKIAFLGAALLLHITVPVRRGRLTRLDAALITAGVLWLVVAALLSESPWESLVGRWPRYEGIPVIAAYAGAVGIGARVLGPGTGSAAAWKSFLRAAAIVSIIVGAVAALEAAGLRPLGGPTDVRPGSTLGNATDLGLAAVLLGGVLVPQALASRSRLLLAGAATAALTVGLSGSRAALLGLLVALGILTVATVLSRGRGPSTRRATGSAVWIGLGAMVALTLATALAVPAVRDRLASTGTITGRFRLWGASADLARDRLLAGTGPSGFVDALPPYLTRDAAIQLGSQTVHDSPHNWLLQAAISGGVVLAAIAVALAARVLWAGARHVREAEVNSPELGAVAAVAGYGVALLTHFTSPGTTPLAAMLAGAVLVASTSDRDDGTPIAVRRATRVLAAASAGVLTTAALAGSAAEWRLQSGTDHLAEGQAAAAQSNFNAAVRLRPWDGDVPLLAAQSLATAASSGVEGAPQLAVDWSRRALARNPHSVEAGLALAVGQLGSGDAAAALVTLDALDERAPHTFLVHVQRGIARFGAGDPVGALADLEAASELDPRSPLPWTVLARILERLGDAGAATAARAEAAAREG